MLEHWTDRQRHLTRLGLVSPEGWPRPNAPQYRRQMTYRGMRIDSVANWDNMSPEWFLASGSLGICYRIRCNRSFKISEVIWRRIDESRAILEACIFQAQVASLVNRTGENRVLRLP